MGYCDPRVYWDKNQGVYDHLIRNFATFGAWLAQSHHHIALFSTDIWFDSQAIQDLAVALNHNSSPVMREPITGLDELLSQMSSMNYIVTCRFHGVVFAHLMNIPVLALSHHPKVVTLMNDLGLSEYCLDIRNFDSDLLIDKFLSLAANRNNIKTRMAEKAALYRKQLNLQFDTLFSQEAH